MVGMTTGSSLSEKGGFADEEGEDTAGVAQQAQQKAASSAPSSIKARFTHICPFVIFPIFRKDR
jgi:hypothetical protein